MITLYQYLPAWSVPCISPYVTKVAYYMTMSGLKFDTKPQDLTRLDRDTPAGKLRALSTPTGRRQRLDAHHPVPARQVRRRSRRRGERTRAGEMMAFNRMIDDHTYWVAVIQPRWRETENWEKYLRIIAGTNDVPAGLRAFADDFRFRILNEFMNGGWGRLPADVIYRRARTDVDALADFLGDKQFFMGEKPRWVDAPVLSILRHIIDAPFAFDTKDYAASKKNLVAYMGRMNVRYGI